MKKNSISPHIIMCYIMQNKLSSILFKNIVETRIVCLHYVFSDTGNTMEDEFGRSAGSKDGVHPT